MPRKPRLAVGMPVYNGERYLRQALDAHLEQTFEDFLIVIADNASTDGTAEICLETARRDKRIVYHRHRQNIGAAANFNAVFHLTSAELFRWSADDDLMLPDYLARCIERLDHEPQLSHCHSWTGEIDEEGRRIGDHEGLLALVSDRPSRRLAASFRMGYPDSIWAVMRSECVSRTRLHGSYLGSDWTFVAEMLLQGGLGLVPDYLFLVRNHPEAFSSASNQRTSKAERLQWFDPDGKSPPFMSAVYCAWNLMSAVMKYPLPMSERVACLRAIAARTGTKVARKLHVASPLLLALAALAALPAA